MQTKQHVPTGETLTYQLNTLKAVAIGVIRQIVGEDKGAAITIPLSEENIRFTAVTSWDYITSVDYHHLYTNKGACIDFNDIPPHQLLRIADYINAN
jgi:hypothetical protein